MRKAKWNFEIFKKTALKNPVLIEGLPGIGNVGKIAVDFIIDELKAEKLYEISGYSMPNSVFVNEKNLVELPKIEMFYKKMRKGRDLMLLTGDVQPIDEESTYEFCEDVIDSAKKYGVSEIITLGGIGLGDVPKKARVFCTGNSIKLIESYKKDTNVNTNLHGIVGPIVGVSGLLLGLSQKKNIEAVSLLTETYGHPMYLGVKAAKETLSILNSKLGLGIDTKKLDKEITRLEKDMKKSEETSFQTREDKAGEVHYIG
ncbi:hypothetical protein GOV08_01035 [Candidatus Woesearchaeota archaeon]|nr:hypothetical protein [Candidatus Woesearchaeota archaeon]